MVTVETLTRRVKVKLLEVVKDDSELLRQKLASSVQSESSSLLDLCSTLWIVLCYNSIDSCVILKGKLLEKNITEMLNLADNI